MEKPIYVSGYVRNARPKHKNSDTNKLALVMIAVIMALFLAVYWKFTLAVGGGVSLYSFATRYHRFISDPARLVVNRFDMNRGAQILVNIKDMIREG